MLSIKSRSCQDSALLEQYKERYFKVDANPYFFTLKKAETVRRKQAVLEVVKKLLMI